MRPSTAQGSRCIGVDLQGTRPSTSQGALCTRADLQPVPQSVTQSASQVVPLAVPDVLPAAKIARPRSAAMAAVRSRALAAAANRSGSRPPSAQAGSRSPSAQASQCMQADPQEVPQSVAQPILQVAPLAVPNVIPQAVPHALCLRIAKRLQALLALAIWRHAAVHEQHSWLEQAAALVVDDSMLHKVGFYFRGSRMVDDWVLRTTAAALPLGLSECSADLTSCPGFSGLGLLAFTQSVPGSTKVLSLRLGNTRIDDEALARFATHVPCSLFTFELHLEQCLQIGNPGVTALGRSLPSWSELRELNLGLEYCKDVGDVAVASIAQGMPRSLRVIRLGLSACEKISDAGIAALAQGFRQAHGLHTAELDFSFCTALTDAGVAALALGLPASMWELKLNVGGCKRVGNTGVVALAKGLPAALASLSLCFRHCRVDDSSLLFLVQAVDQLSLSSCALDVLLTKATPEVVERCRLAGTAVTGLQPRLSRSRSRCQSAGVIRAPKPDVASVVEAAGPAAVPAEPIVVHGRRARISATAPRGLELWTLTVAPTAEDADITEDAWILPAGLMSLVCDLSRAPQLTHLGVSGLLSKLPSSLVRLELRLGGHLRIDDAAVANAAAVMPATLLSLRLDLSACEAVSDAGVASLAESLPARLQVLRLCLWCCDRVGDPGVAALSQGLPASLLTLHLDLRMCRAIGDAGLAALARRLPVYLGTLELDLRATRVSPEKKALCRSLTAVRLWRPKMSEVALPALPFRHPEPLHEEVQNFFAKVASPKNSGGSPSVLSSTADVPLVLPAARRSTSTGCLPTKPSRRSMATRQAQRGDEPSAKDASKRKVLPRAVKHVSEAFVMCDVEGRGVVDRELLFRVARAIRPDVPEDEVAAVLKKAGLPNSGPLSHKDWDTSTRQWCKTCSVDA